MTAMTKQPAADSIERVLVGGDLKALSPDDRVRYYNAVCASLGLNPLTRPFDYLTLNGKLILYARKDATEQLRKRDQISVTITDRQVIQDVYVVTARAETPDGRKDEDQGAVSIAGLKGEALANAYLKATTKAKRRVTLSICGLGMLDETEVESIPDARPAAHDDRPAKPLPAGLEGVPGLKRGSEADVTPAQQKQVNEIIRRLGWDRDRVKDFAAGIGLPAAFGKYTLTQAQTLIEHLEEELRGAQPAADAPEEIEV